MTANSDMTTAAPPRQGCAPWCAVDGDHGICQPAYDSITVEDSQFRRWDFAAFPVQSATGRAYVSAGVSGHCHGVIWIADPGEATELADLLDALSVATPEQHRALAEQVRAAAGLLDVKGDARA